MADIQALAVSARNKLKNGDAVTMGIAIRKAIEGVGIRHKPDVKKLMSEVGKKIHDEDRALRQSKRRLA